MIAAVAAVAFLLAVSAAPMAAAPNGIQLSDPSVSPRTGTPKTKIVITVVYKSGKGGRAGEMTASIGGKSYPMARVAGGTWETGVTFRWAGSLPLGSYPVVLKAAAKGNAVASIGAGTIKIAPPAPAPTAKPKATPKPTARTTTRPAPTKAPIVTQIAARPTPSPTAPTSNTPSVSETADPTFLPPLILTLAAVDQGPSDPIEPGGPGGSGVNVPANPSGGSGDGRGGGSGVAWGPLAGMFAAVGLSGPTWPPLPLGPTLVTTTGAVATAMAFGVFGRRRRDDASTDEGLSAAAATGVSVGPDQLLGSANPIAGLASGTGTAVAPVEERIDESLLPRWRRPSLLQARKLDPVRDSIQTPRLTFDQGLVGPLAGHERRTIRYRVVRLLDSPDELRGTEIGYLDQGDEVQLLEKYGAYWLVLCPDGQQGWLHKMVLGDIVDADGVPAEVPADIPVATMPSVADSWTMAEDDIDSDVFTAYLEARRRRAD